jgi:geranylgeranyl diphosphate synthase type I
MDQDRLRRGGKTIFAQYEDYAKSKKLTRPKLIGQNLGICVGDIGFFLAIDLINKTSISQQKKEKILRVISEEYILVILGQMQDVILGAKRKDPSEEEILQVYRLKTARYTFSLPLLLGAMLAKLPLNIQEQLVEIGEDLGILYQIKDDELNIFGRQKIIGKSIGSDISENKKTILRYYLFKQVSKGQRMDIRKFFGKSLSTSDINKIRQLIIKSGTLKKLEDVMRGFEIKVKNKINALQLPQEYKDTLVELLEFVKSRNN